MNYVSSNLQTPYPFRSIGPLGSSDLPFAFFVADLSTPAVTSFVLRAISGLAVDSVIGVTVDGVDSDESVLSVSAEGVWLLVRISGDITLTLHEDITDEFEWPLELGLTADQRALSSSVAAVTAWEIELSDSVSYSTAELEIQEGYNRSVTPASATADGVTVQTVTITGGGGDGLGSWSSCSASFVTSICGQTPDPTGNVTIASEDCFSVFPAIGEETDTGARSVSAGALSLNNHCLPCLSCESIDTVYVDGFGPVVEAAQAAKESIYETLAGYKSLLSSLSSDESLVVGVKLVSAPGWGVTVQATVKNNTEDEIPSVQLMVSVSSGVSLVGTGYGSIEYADGTSVAISGKTLPLLVPEFAVPAGKSVVVTLACVAAPGSGRTDGASVTVDALALSDEAVGVGYADVALQKAYNKVIEASAAAEDTPLDIEYEITQEGSLFTVVATVTPETDTCANSTVLVSIQSDAGIVWGTTAVVVDADGSAEKVYDGQAEVNLGATGEASTITLTGTLVVTEAAVAEYTITVSGDFGVDTLQTAIYLVIS